MADLMHNPLEWIRMNIPPWVYIALAVHGAVLGAVAYLILLERKVASWAQDRIGPNRVGFEFVYILMPGFLKKLFPKQLRTANGLGQPLADGIKFILKEDYCPGGVDKILFSLAPMIMITVVIISIAVLPWGGTLRTTRHVTLAPGQDAMAYVPWSATLVNPPVVNGSDATVTYQWPFQIANLNIGVLFVLATLSLAVYGVVIGGWASNNKYSFLGGLRATANMISYEIPLGLAVLCLVLMFGSLDMGNIVEKQCHNWLGFIPAWNMFTQPLAFTMFVICMHAEANRAPFDLAEAEQELVGGYHTEYSAMRFALFFLAEYAGMITTSAVCVALFMGGWDFPGLRGADSLHPAITSSIIISLIRCGVFFAKTVFIIFVFMWVRWSLPRFRFDQLMMLAWRALIPISLALLLMTAIIVYAFGGESYLQDATSFGVSAGMEIWLLIANLITLGAIIFITTLLPAAPATNRKVIVQNSRFKLAPAKA